MALLSMLCVQSNEMQWRWNVSRHHFWISMWASSSWLKWPVCLVILDITDIKYYPNDWFVLILQRSSSTPNLNMIHGWLWLTIFLTIVLFIVWFAYFYSINSFIIFNYVQLKILIDELIFWMMGKKITRGKYSMKFMIMMPKIFNRCGEDRSEYVKIYPDIDKNQV